MPRKLYKSVNADAFCTTSYLPNVFSLSLSKPCLRETRKIEIVGVASKGDRGCVSIDNRVHFGSGSYLASGMLGK